MPRTASDIGTGSNMPPAGSHRCRCIKAEPWRSPTKKTPAVKLTWARADTGETFEDEAYLSPKALWRLNLVAQRIAGMPPDFPLPDDDAEAGKTLARFITDHIVGKMAIVTIEAKKETYMAQSGENAGTLQTKTRLRVGAGGYATTTDAAPAPNPTPPPDASPRSAAEPEDVEDDTIPF